MGTSLRNLGGPCWYLYQRETWLLQCIGLMEVMWKVVEAVIYIRIKIVVQFHDVLHMFCAGTGTGIAIMEIKLAQ